MTPSGFTATRRAVHHAVQVPSSWGATHLPADPEHQYANMGWDARFDALVGRRTQGLAAGLRVRSMTWVLLKGTEIVAERGVRGSTLAEGLAWLQAAATAQGAPDAALSPVGYDDLPKHPVASGAPFDALDEPTLVHVAQVLMQAHTALQRVAAAHPEASELRFWPHHADLATLLQLDPRAPDPETARTVGVGVSLGDATYPEPYYYVTPWPYPHGVPGPPLPYGAWHTDGWFGAVLSCPLQGPGPDDTARDRFLTEAVAAAQGLLNAAGDRG